ncbi:hypothetical protein F5Y14DRAFT_445566 [Nemania sp. NC0429]|nr:hypothetical protein F5Y14DRAFT_445566 [Nemania sp. NC0429]
MCTLCLSSNSPPASPGPDSRSDASSDIGSDAHIDARSDVGSDASIDPLSDVGIAHYLDISIDARSDAGSDAVSDHSDSSDTSDSSTVVYGHEPFVTFESRVRDLAQKIWPDASPFDITVERLPGGGYNRIIGLAKKTTSLLEADEPSGGPDTLQYIVRLPRFDSSNVRNDVAALHFVKRFTTIPAPEVIKWNETDENELDSPFQIQNRIPGTTLLSAYTILTHPQRCKLAHELGTAFASMLAVKSSTSGVFVQPLDANLEEALEGHVKIVPICGEDRESNSSSMTFSSSAATTPVLDLFKSCIQEKKDEYQLRDPPLTFKIAYMDRFMAMASELDEGGWFVNDHYSLAHLDFHPRNILVHPTSDTELPVLSGILDWDSAILAPMFMSCLPPMWLWAWALDEDEDERKANDEPPTEESRELKRLFESAAGPDYLRHAYQPAFRLARQLLHFVINGLRTKEDCDEADAMLFEWGSIHQAKPGST